MRRFLVGISGVMMCLGLVGCSSSSNANSSSHTNGVSNPNQAVSNVSSNTTEEISSNNTTGNATTNTVEMSTSSDTTNTSSSPNPPRLTFINYTNKRFGFSVKIPSKFVGQTPPADGDGETWQGKNSAKIIAYGGYNVTNETVRSVLDSLVKKDHPSYKKTGSDWLVVSGNKGSQIYYTKEYIGHSKEYTVTIEYPKSDKTEYSKMVSEVSSSFRPGPIQSMGSATPSNQSQSSHSQSNVSSSSNNPTNNRVIRIKSLTPNDDGFVNEMKRLGPKVDKFGRIADVSWQQATHSSGYKSLEESNIKLWEQAVTIDKSYIDGSVDNRELRNVFQKPTLTS